MKQRLSEWIKCEYVPPYPDKRTVKKHAAELGITIVRELGQDWVVLDDDSKNPILKAYDAA